MSFASPLFLWYFLPLTLAITWILPNSLRNAAVAAASIVFYAVGGGAFTVLLLVSIAWNYAAGLLLGRTPTPTPTWRRAVLVGAVGADLGVLLVWKYADFGSRQWHRASVALGFGDSAVLRLVLPIGISFYVFHQISYVVDVYRTTRTAQHDPLTFVTYVCMFPQLISGPIVRYHEIADQLQHRTTGKWDDLADGFPRFCLGLCKKVVIADSLAPIASGGFDARTAQLSTGSAWLGVLAYTLQIYFDFSGYSDMAIGLGRMLGFQLPENFNRPYSAESITDFWRRWHMSLSRWFRDYLYIPLGGNRGSNAATYRNLIIVFLLVGFWHGANWTFVVWGAYHGSLLVVERVTGLARTATPRSRVPRRALTLVLVAIGWVFFRASTIGHGAGMLARMFTWHGSALSPAISAALTHRAVAALLVGACVVLLPGGFVMGRYLQFSRAPSAAALRLAYQTVGVGYAAILVAAGTFSPFLYYQF